MIPLPATIRFGIALALSLLAQESIGAFARDSQTRQLSVGGVERHYIISAPAAGGTRPAIIVLHGGGMSANSGMRSTGMEPLAERENLVAVYPNALHREWNDGREERTQTRGNADDVAFIRALTASLIAEGVVDPSASMSLDRPTAE